MLALLRQRRWIGFTIFVLAMMVLCLFLARWQWHRYEIRRAENARLDAALSAPATPVDALVAAVPAGSAPSTLDPALDWRTVTATGTFDQAGERAVRRRPLNGKTGFWIVTPLITSQGTILVNRGWAPSGADALAGPTVTPAPTGEVTVTGKLRAGEPTTAKDPAPSGQAWSVDPTVLLADVSGPRYDSAYIELRSAQPAASDGLVTLTEEPGHRGLNNLVYSVQWLIFALVGAIGWWRLMHQEQAAAEQADAAEQEPLAAG